MAFFKKNIVLASSKTMGYVTIIRISASVGIKVMLNEPQNEKAYVGVFTATEHFFGMLEGAKAEFENLNLDIKGDEDIGVCLFNEKGLSMALGGKISAVNKTKVEEFLEDMNKAKIKQLEEERLSNAELKNNPIMLDETKKATPNNISTISIEKLALDESSSANGSTKKTNDKHRVNQVINGAETMEDLLNKGKGKNFYFSIKDKLDELMIIHPPETILEEMIPESKWVMVHYTKTDYYVVGVLKNNDMVTHIAYGLRGMENVPPPKEAKDICDFITTEKKNDKSYGYYLFFQSAESGEITKTL